MEDREENRPYNAGRKFGPRETLHREKGLDRDVSPKAFPFSDF